MQIDDNKLSFSSYAKDIQNRMEYYNIRIT